MANWKEISHILTEMHNNFGRAAVSVGGDNAFQKVLSAEAYLRDITTDEIASSWDSKELTQKQIRRWVWNIRKNPILEDERTILLTGYDAENETSQGGLAQFSDTLEDPFTIKVELEDG